jgi:glycosyltransferase involved in cell wall biosynthesis
MTTICRSNKKNIILFISHDASRTGAPIVLLTFLKWLHNNSNHKFIILLRNGGELLEEFQSIAPTINLDQSRQRSVLFNRLLTQLKLPSLDEIITKIKLRLFIKKKDIALIYSNTVTNWKLLQELSYTDAPIITHVHELGYYINSQFSFHEIKNYTKIVDRFIAVSEAVKNYLISLGIESKDIEVVYEFIQERTQITNELLLSIRSEIRKELGLSSQDFVALACGTLDWRKGADLFIQVAYFVNKSLTNRPVKFIWMGMDRTGETQKKITHDIEKSGIWNIINIVGSKNNPIDFFIASDIFLLTSREDPFPLVMLESASVGKPIICFDNSGGAVEFVGDDSGFIVPYLDLNAMAEKIIALREDIDLYHKLSNNAQKKSELYSLDIQAPKILKIIEGLLQIGN